jgi:hypothetical protein
MTSSTNHWKPGAKVLHARRGRGRVRSIRPGGATVVVAFDQQPGLPLAIPSVELAEIGSPDPAMGQSPPQSPTSPQMSPADALGVLEALKLGVVPEEALDCLSVGCESLMEQVHADLDQAADAERSGSFRLIVGDYGWGKSHLMDRIERTARQRNFLVARAAFGAVETTPDRPLALYRALAGSIRYPRGSERGLARLLDEAAASSFVLERWTGRPHAWLSPGILARRLALRGGPDDGPDRLVKWLEGEPQKPALLYDIIRQAARENGQPERIPGLMRSDFRSLPVSRTATQTTCYMLGGIGRLACDVGYAGLVLLIDEAEHADWLRERDRVHAERLIQGLLAAALPEVDDSLLERGGGKNQRSIPYRFCERQHLACFLAMAPQAAGTPSIVCGEIDGRRRSTIPALGASDLKDLARKVLAVASWAGVSVSDIASVQQDLLEHIDRECRRGQPPPPRQVVKLAAGLPDTLRFATSISERPVRGWMGLVEPC